jgi:zinc protease
MSAKKYKLKNGLSVLTIENHKSPVVSVQMWVKTGSADEAKGQEGISHFIEHLVFKGTKKYGVGDIASSVEAAGGELNAYTSFDQTVFHVTISKHYVDTAMDVIGEMMGFPKFDPIEVDNEREVVLEEIKRGNDSPHRAASQTLFKTAYQSHPYGIPVIGYDKVIKTVSGKKIDQYFKSRYVPTNMQLVIVGDFESKEMKTKIEKQFGRFENYKLKKIARKKEAAQKQVRVQVKQAKFEECIMHLAWPIPGAAHKDIPALDMLAMILGQGDSSRLVKRLRMDSSLVNSVGTGSFTPKDQGLFSLSATLNQDRLVEVLENITVEIELALTTLPSPDEIKRSIVSLESEEFYALETVDGIARKAGGLENLMGDYNYFQKYLKQIHAIIPEDLVKIARKYLVPNKVTVSCLVKDSEKEIAKTFKDWAKAYKKIFDKSIKVKIPKAQKFQKSKMKMKPVDADGGPLKIEKVKLKSGMSIVFRTNQSTPILNVRAGALGGLRAEDEKHLGGSDLLSRVWTSGTKDLSELEIQNKIENMAGGISAFSGRNSVGLNMQTLSPFEDEAIELFAEVLVAPVMNDQAIEREKHMMQEALRSRDDNPAQIASLQFMQSVFAGHPYANDMMGSKESIANLDKKYLEDHMKKMLNLENMMVVVTGDANKAKWISALEKASKKIGHGQNLKQKFVHKAPVAEVRRFKHMNKEQTHILLGYKGLTINDPKRHALQVMQSVLAGQGGRLFLELRDKESLAYTVSPMHMDGLDTGYFGAYIGCSPEKAKKAISMLKAEFAKLVDKKIGDEELARAKKYLIGRYDIDLQRNSAIGSSILFNELYGIDCAETFKFADHINSVTANEIQDVASQIFKQKDVISAVGASEPW